MVSIIELAPNVRGHQLSLGYTRLDTEDVDLSVLTGRYGYQFSQHLRLEGDWVSVSMKHPTTSPLRSS